ncbi:MAG TPA: endoribonuclease MazF [Acidobacteriaceae bacterium]
MRKGYVPGAGDLIWVDFDPQAGREQAGRRPALVLSPALYNRRTGLLVGCPVTSRPKGYPFEVQVPGSTAKNAVRGAVLVDHVKSIDWRERRAEPAGRLEASGVEAVKELLGILLQMGERR